MSLRDPQEDDFACNPDAQAPPLRAPRGHELAVALAGLGPILLLERIETEGGEGIDCALQLARACASGSVVAAARVDPGAGMHEEVALFDRAGVLRLRLVRLPESDWMGWERATACAGAWSEAPLGAAPPRERSVQAHVVRAARRVQVWRARPVRLQQGDDDARPLRLLPLAHCSWHAWRVLDALRAGADVELYAGA